MKYHFCILFLLSIEALAQRPTFGPTATMNSDEKVFLLGADSMNVSKLTDGTELRRVAGKVVFRHKGALMYCNLAIHNVFSNAIEAFGNVRVLQGDTVSLTGDTLFYYGNTRMAKVMGKTVTLKDRKSTVTSNRIEYDMAAGLAYYPNRGKTVDEENTLTSRQGYYDTRNKVFTYYREVKLVNKKYTLTTDTLVYNSLTKVADFRSLTKVVSKDGNLEARNGSYNTATGASVFRTRTTIDNTDYTLTGDSLTFDNLTKKGFAKGNVELVSKTDDTILNGDFGRYDGKAGRSKVWGHALTRTVISKDTLFMTADTLYSIEIQPDSLSNDSISNAPKQKITEQDTTNKKPSLSGKVPPKDGGDTKNPLSGGVSRRDGVGKDTTNQNNPRRLIASRNVMVYKKDLQSKSDSLIYNTSDSTITFLKKPIIWSSKYQLEADTIVALMVKQKLRTMLLRVKSFVIARDTLINFNQVKGRRITAYFDDSTRLERVFVEGNGESIYFAAGEDKKAMGMNRVECAKMTLYFKENQVKKIQFIGQPDGRFIPPHDIKPTDKQLEGFSWREQEKPTQKQVLEKANFKPKPVIIVKKPETPKVSPNKTEVKGVLPTKKKPKAKKV